MSVQSPIQPLFYFNFEDSSIQLYTDGCAIAPIGNLKLKVGECVKKIDFCTNREFLCFESEELLDRICLYDTFLHKWATLTTEEQNRMFCVLEKHSPKTEIPYNFAKIITKIQNICNKEENRLLKFIPLKKSEIDQITSQIDQFENKTILPFKLIQLTLKNPELFSQLITNILYCLNARKFKAQIRNEFTTSCAHSALVVETLFFGLEKTIKIANFCGRRLSSTFDLTLPSGQDYVYISKNYSGMLFSNLRKEDPFILSNNHKIEIDHDTTTEFNQSFSNYVKSTFENNSKEIDDEKAINCFQLAAYSFPFNQPNLVNLISELQTNSSQITNKTSFGYSIRLKDSFGFIQHAFVIEQFLKTSDNSIGHRIYQSWIGQAGLKEDIDKQKYDEKGNNVLNLEEIVQFLEKIEVYFMLEEKEGERKEALTQIFGYHWCFLPLLTSFSDNVIKSCDLVYWCEKIDLNQIISQLNQLTKDFDEEECIRQQLER